MAEEYKVRNMLFLEEDRRKVVKHESGDSFSIKAIFPADRKFISRQMAILQNGMPATTYDSNSLYFFEREAVINVCLVADVSPPWWQGADKCPDEELLNWLYIEIVNWTNEFQARIKKNQFAGTSQATGALA